MATITIYYPLKKIDGWHVMRKTEYDPPVRYDDLGVYAEREEALRQIAMIEEDDRNAE